MYFFHTLNPEWQLNQDKFLRQAKELDQIWTPDVVLYDLKVRKRDIHRKAKEPPVMITSPKK